MADLNRYTVTAETERGNPVEFDVKPSSRSGQNWRLDYRSGQHHFKSKKSVEKFLKRLGYKKIQS